MSARPRLLFAIATALGLAGIIVIVSGRGRSTHAPWNNLSLVTPVSLALACGAAIALLGACVLVIGRAVLDREQDVGPSTTPAPSRWRSVAWLTALFLIVFSAKLQIIRDNPATAPFWDQWDGEARVLFVPYSESSLAWRTMFDLHNEHRVLFTRLLALGLLEANGQWDPRLETVVNAAMHSLTAVLLASVFWISSGRRRLDLLVFVCALVFVLPFAWENTLMGFSSNFYFLLLFSVLALWLTTRYRVATAPWWLGWLCAVSGLFTAAGGVIVPAAIAGVVVLKLAGDRRGWREAVINGGAAALVLALGIAVASPALAYHEMLRAKTVTDFLGALTQDLAWPWIGRPRMSAVMWLPLGALLAAAWLRRAKTTELERLVVGFGIWAVLTACALAYGRGAGAAVPAYRYMDLLSLGFITNAVALVAILERARAGTVARHIALGTIMVWLVVAIVGLDRLTGRATIDLGAWHPLFTAYAANVRRFMVTGNVTEFVSKQPLVELPYPDSNRLATLLLEPAIRRILPAAVRRPLHVEPRVITNDAFVMGGPPAGSMLSDPLARSWSSLSDQGKRAQGRFESQPLACQLGGRLKFQVSGYRGWKGQYLPSRTCALAGIWSSHPLDSPRTTGLTPSFRARTVRSRSWLSRQPIPGSGFESLSKLDGHLSWPSR